MFKGMHTMFYNDQGVPCYKHVRLIPIKSIDDQGEHAPKAGRRGGNAIRQTAYTCESQSDPIVCGHSVGHHQTFYTSTVQYTYIIYQILNSLQKKKKNKKHSI